MVQSNTYFMRARLESGLLLLVKKSGLAKISLTKIGKFYC